ncbi:MAG: hypothetical protein Q9157_002061 [Trypethelium eluteriae]
MEANGFDFKTMTTAWIMSGFDNIDPAWKTCGGDIRGVYDPPYALQQGFAAATPTPANAIWAPAPASPASAPDTTQPLQTFNVIQNPGSHDPVAGNPRNGDPLHDGPASEIPHFSNAGTESPQRSGISRSAEPADSTNFHGYFTSETAFNSKSLAGMSADILLSTVGGSQGSAQSANAGSAAAGIVALIGKEDKAAGKDSYHSITGPDGADPATEGNSLAGSDGSTGAKTDFDHLQNTNTGNRNLPGDPGRRQSGGHYESDTTEQASSASFLVTSGQRSPGGLQTTRTGTGLKEYSDGTQPDSHKPDKKGFSEGYLLVGGQRIAKDPSKLEDLLIGNHHLQKGQATKIAGIPISIGSIGVVIGRTFTVPFDSISVRGNAIATSTSSSASQTSHDSSRTPIIDQPNPVAAISHGLETIGRSKSITVNSAVISESISDLINNGRTTTLLPSEESVSSRPAQEVAIQTSLIISGKQYTAYEVVGPDCTAIILGTSHQPTKISASSAAVTLERQVVSLASDNMYILKFSTGNSAVVWSKVTAIGNDLPCGISSVVAPVLSTTSSQIMGRRQFGQVQALKMKAASFTALKD